MKSKRPRRETPGGAVVIAISVSKPEAKAIQDAAKRKKMSLSGWCRGVMLPIALYQLADKARTSLVLDKIQQEVKVAEQTFDVD